MPCHHRCSCPHISQAWSKSPHAISSGRISHQVNFVWIDIHASHSHCDYLPVEFVRLRMEMQIPSIKRCTWTKIYCILWMIKPQLVFPLLVIHFGCHSSTSVKRNKQSASTFWFFAEYHPSQWHSIFANGQTS